MFTMTYDIVYDLYLPKHTTSYFWEVLTVTYYILGKTYEVAKTYDIVGLTSYVISYVRCRMYDVAYAVVGPTYDVVDEDVRRMTP